MTAGYRGRVAPAWRTRHQTLDRLSHIVATLELGKHLDAEMSPGDLISALGMMLIGYMAQRRGDGR
jgi:hypothetical protein